MSLAHISQLVLPGEWGRDGISPLWAMAPPVSQPPLVAEALTSVSPLPAPSEDFGVSPVMFFAQECPWLQFHGGMRLLGTAVCWASTGFWSSALVPVLSLLPFACSPCSPLPVPPITLPWAWPCLHKGCLLLAVLLNSHWALTSALGFSRGSQVLVFVAFWFYLKGEARKFPSSLQNVASFLFLKALSSPLFLKQFQKSAVFFVMLWVSVWWCRGVAAVKCRLCSDWQEENKSRAWISLLWCSDSLLPAWKCWTWAFVWHMGIWRAVANYSSCAILLKCLK